MAPQIQRLHLASGDLVEIRSRHGHIVGAVEPDAGARASVVSMSHAFGEAPGVEADPCKVGGNFGRLASFDEADTSARSRE